MIDEKDEKDDNFYRKMPEGIHNPLIGFNHEGGFSYINLSQIKSMYTVRNISNTSNTCILTIDFIDGKELKFFINCLTRDYIDAKIREMSE